MAQHGTFAHSPAGGIHNPPHDSSVATQFQCVTVSAGIPQRLILCHGRTHEQKQEGSWETYLLFAAHRPRDKLVYL